MPDGTSVPVILHGGVTKPIASTYPGLSNSLFSDINNDGTIAGVGRINNQRVFLLATESTTQPLTQTLGAVEDCGSNVAVNSNLQVAATCGNFIFSPLAVVLTDATGQMVKHLINDPLVMSLNMWGLTDQEIVWGNLSRFDGISVHNDPFVADITGIYRDSDAGYAQRAAAIPALAATLHSPSLPWTDLPNDNGQLLTSHNGFLAIYDSATGYTQLPQSSTHSSTCQINRQSYSFISAVNGLGFNNKGTALAGYWVVRPDCSSMDDVQVLKAAEKKSRCRDKPRSLPP